jgi:hypothetical protein
MTQIFCLIHFQDAHKRFDKASLAYDQASYLIMLFNVCNLFIIFRVINKGKDFPLCSCMNNVYTICMMSVWRLITSYLIAVENCSKLGVFILFC